MPVALLQAILDELIRARLLDVIVEPWQVELVHAEADKVEEGLDIIDG